MSIKSSGSFATAIAIPIGILVTIWLVFILQNLGLGQNDCLGIAPRSAEGLKGILLAPLLHSTADFSHIMNNSVPLGVLLFFLFAVYRNLGFVVLVLGWVLTGFLVWVFADFTLLSLAASRSCHIGASGLVYMLAGFIFSSGVIRRSINAMALAFIVAFLYGSMIWGVLPQDLLPIANPNLRISWESHLLGLLVGIALAIKLRKFGPQRKKYIWEQKEHVDIQAEILWQNYLASLPEGEEPKTWEEVQEENRSKKKGWKDLL